MLIGNYYSSHGNWSMDTPKIIHKQRARTKTNIDVIRNMICYLCECQLFSYIDACILWMGQLVTGLIIGLSYTKNSPATQIYSKHYQSKR